MANHPSAAKRNRQRIKRAQRNRQILSSVRTSVKKARTALAGGDAEQARSRVQTASKAVAAASSKGVLHWRTASRTISRIQRALHKLAT